MDQNGQDKGQNLLYLKFKLNNYINSFKANKPHNYFVINLIIKNPNSNIYNQDIQYLIKVCKLKIFKKITVINNF